MGYSSNTSPIKRSTMSLNETNVIKFGFLIEIKTAPKRKNPKIGVLYFFLVYIGIVFAIVKHTFYWRSKNFALNAEPE
jgi:hypothetical protein